MTIADFRTPKSFDDLLTMSNNTVAEYQTLYYYAKRLEDEIQGFDGVIDDTGNVSMDLMPKPASTKMITFLSKAAERGFNAWQQDNPDVKASEDTENCFSSCVGALTCFSNIALFQAIVSKAYELTQDEESAKELINSLTAGAVPADIAEMLDEYANGTDFDHGPR